MQSSSVLILAFLLRFVFSKAVSPKNAPGKRQIKTSYLNNENPGESLSVFSSNICLYWLVINISSSDGLNTEEK